MAETVYLLYKADLFDPTGHLLGVYSKREVAEKYRDLIEKVDASADAWVEEHGLIKEA